MSETRYNPEDRGNAFNEQPHVTFTELTDEDTQQAERLAKLVEHSRATLGTLSAQDNED